MIEHDDGTFFEIVDIHLDALYTQANRLTQSAPNAEELVQATIMRAHYKFSNYNFATDFRRWLFIILKEMNDECIGSDKIDSHTLITERI